MIEIDRVTNGNKTLIRYYNPNAHPNYGIPTYVIMTEHADCVQYFWRASGYSFGRYTSLLNR